MSVTIPIKNPSAAEAYCTKHIGPRTYYLHRQFGGAGWVIKRTLKSVHDTGHFLIIEDDKKAMLAILFLSDQ